MITNPSRPAKKTPSKGGGKCRDPLLTSATRTAFGQALIEWYEANKRDLPWRHTRNPYAIAVSEFMLQQTQVTTVLPYYDRWLRQFPTWGALAAADEGALLKAWEGLGYYRRARNLQRLAQAVTELPSGELPRSPLELQALPGIGPYTAGAIASFAFDQAAPVLDGNVIRVLSRVFALKENVESADVKERLWQWAAELQPAEQPAAFNQAIMELGALVCTPRHPRCLVCPLRKVCAADDPERYPLKTRMEVIRRSETVAVIRKGNRWWCEQVPVGERLAAMWRFPAYDSGLMRRGAVLLRFPYTITKYRVDLTAVGASWLIHPEGVSATERWLTLQEIEDLPFPSAHRKLARKLIEERRRLMVRKPPTP